jgi:uncharacterized membrane protein
MAMTPSSSGTTARAAAASLAHTTAVAASRSRVAAKAATTVDENVQEIKSWELATLRARSLTEHVCDWIACTAASGPAMVAHVIWFAAWIVINLGWIPHLRPFDPFPFELLTMTVSLEAIFLALFVLGSQNRLARQADKRSHLNLQVDLLAEREMTAVLQLLRDIATHLDVKTSVTADQLRDLARKTDVHQLADRMEEFVEEPPIAAPDTKTASGPAT